VGDYTHGLKFHTIICVLVTEQPIKIMLYDGEGGGMRKIVKPYKNTILAIIL
jgi:hypothetical protein